MNASGLGGKRWLWRLLIGAKLVIIAGVWAMVDSGFTLGDRPVDAAETDKSAAKNGSPTGDAEGKDKDKGDKGKSDATTATKARRSFLANLLELPPLDPESHQKDELGKYMEIAERKKRQVEERLTILKQREEQLKGLENTIDDKLKRLDEERRYFAQTLQQEKNLKGERMDKLVSMYAKMEPKKAAPVMEKLDKDLTIELFKQLPQKQVTAILEAMNPASSVSISEYYGRVRSTREYDVLKEMNQSLRKEFDDCKGLPAGKE